MSGWEAAAVWATIALYAAAWIVHMTGLVFKQDKLQGAGPVLAGLGLAAHTVAVVARWVATGHAPVVDNYENALAGTWAVVLALWAVARRWPALWTGEAVVLPLVLLTLGYGLLRSPVPTTLTPAYQSPWLFVHVLFAWLGYAAFTVASAVGVLYLCKRRHPAGERWAHLPSLEELDLLGYRLIAFGFVMAAVMLVSGALWANRLWGSYWSWDPVETWSLVSWLVYGIYLHLRLLHGWRGAKAAWYAVAALVTVLISFWGINLFQVGWHVFQTLR